jgi:arginine decarboxylase
MKEKRRTEVDMEKYSTRADLLDIPLDEFDAPILKKLLWYVNQDPARFHMPGHKGVGYPPEILEAFSKNMLAMDVTETRGMDNLHLPAGCIKQAQDLASRTFGADRTFFLTNGTTAGIHAMLMTTCKEGQKVIIPRDAHLSVIGGVVLAGLVPVFVYPDIDPEWGIGMGVRPEAYEQALKEHPEAKACLITRPNYYGIAGDLAPLAEICHERDIPLLVDEAHGPHICFHGDLPTPALEYGADMVVHSTHKTLGSFTGSSMLHIQGPRIHPDRVQRMLAILQSTSPSYLLMASIDIAATIMRLRGRELIERALRLSDRARSRLQGVHGVRVLYRPGMDRLRLTVSMIQLGLAGYDLKNRLLDDYNVRVELADLENVVAFITYADSEERVDLLVDAILRIAEEEGGRKGDHLQMGLAGNASSVNARKPARRRSGTQAEFTRSLFAPAERALLPRQATLAAHELVEVAGGVGRVCAEVVAPYPPGIPLLYPGEIIDSLHLEIIDEALSLGAVFRGLSFGPDGQLIVTVVKNRRSQ